MPQLLGLNLVLIVFDPLESRPGLLTGLGVAGQAFVEVSVYDTRVSPLDLLLYAARYPVDVQVLLYLFLDLTTALEY